MKPNYQPTSTSPAAWGHLTNRSLVISLTIGTQIYLLNRVHLTLPVPNTLQIYCHSTDLDPISQKQQPKPKDIIRQRRIAYHTYK